MIKKKKDVKPIPKIIRKISNEEEGNLLQKIINSGRVELLPNEKLISKESGTRLNVQEFLAIISCWNKRFDGHEAFVKSILYIKPSYLNKNREFKKMLPIQPSKYKRWMKSIAY